MTTTFLDNKICTFKILLSWRFPQKQAFLDDFPLCPQGPPPPQKRKFNFYCRLAVSDCPRLLAFACVFASAFACVTLLMFVCVCVCVCSHLLSPPFVAPPLCVTLTHQDRDELHAPRGGLLEQLLGIVGGSEANF